MKTLRVFAISDLHVDYQKNRQWFDELSSSDYKNDVLIIAGDITCNILLLVKTLSDLSNKFFKVFFVPGNHDLWVARSNEKDSISRFHLIIKMMKECGVIMEPYQMDELSIVPLFGWYDYSFGTPIQELKDIWMDFIACNWPDGFDDVSLTKHFTSLNKDRLFKTTKFVISFSHFLPRIDVMPSFIPPSKKILYPILGTYELERQIRKLGSNIHIYGHSHVNRFKKLDGILYINNAFGYPNETRITRKELLCVYEK